MTNQHNKPDMKFHIYDRILYILVFQTLLFYQLACPSNGPSRKGINSSFVFDFYQTEKDGGYSLNVTAQSRWTTTSTVSNLIQFLNIVRVEKGRRCRGRRCI